MISPESCSSILWKTWEYKEQAAAALKLTANDLIQLGVIDGVVPEPKGGAHRDHKEAASLLKKQIVESLSRLGKMDADQLVSKRVEKYSAMGVHLEVTE